MKRIYTAVIFLILTITYTSAQTFEEDVISTSKGDLKITFVKHASLMFEYEDKVMHIDPVLRMGNYNLLPKADIILITHDHGDHFDMNAIQKLSKNNTRIIVTPKCTEISEKLETPVIMSNGDTRALKGFMIKAVPAYNIKHKRKNDKPYHPKGEGNGYVILVGGKKIYIAGDTENIPEMKKLNNIDIAFLPMNLPYTMTPEMVADAVKMIKPGVIYPYHFGTTNTLRLVELLKNRDVEIRIRDMGF